MNCRLNMKELGWKNVKYDFVQFEKNFKKILIIDYYQNIALQILIRPFDELNAQMVCSKDTGNKAALPNKVNIFEIF